MSAPVDDPVAVVTVSPGDEHPRPAAPEAGGAAPLVPVPGHCDISPVDKGQRYIGSMIIISKNHVMSYIM